MPLPQWRTLLAPLLLTGILLYAVDLRVDVSLNGNRPKDLLLDWNPDRVGHYEVTIPSSIVAPGVQHLTLGSTGGFKLWYVLITPK